MQDQVLTSTTLEGSAAKLDAGHGGDPGSPGDQLPRWELTSGRPCLPRYLVPAQSGRQLRSLRALRNAVNQQLQDAAESSANLLGVYAVFEPNQLDGDDNYQGSTALGASLTRGVSPAIGPGSMAR